MGSGECFGDQSALFPYWSFVYIHLCRISGELVESVSENTVLKPLFYSVISTHEQHESYENYKGSSDEMLCTEIKMYLSGTEEASEVVKFSVENDKQKQRYTYEFKLLKHTMFLPMTNHPKLILRCDLLIFFSVFLWGEDSSVTA